MTFEDFVFGAVVLFAIVLLVILVVAVIDSIPQLDEGVVVSKEYEKSRLRWTGKMWIRDDEDWCIYVEGVTDSGKQRTERWEVSESLYNLIDVGDFVFKQDDVICVEE